MWLSHCLPFVFTFSLTAFFISLVLSKCLSMFLRIQISISLSFASLTLFILFFLCDFIWTFIVHSEHSTFFRRVMRNHFSSIFVHILCKSPNKSSLNWLNEIKKKRNVKERNHLNIGFYVYRWALIIGPFLLLCFGFHWTKKTRRIFILYAFLTFVGFLHFLFTFYPVI